MKVSCPDEAIILARDLLEMDAYILDTETTGFTKNDVVIEIGIINLNGDVKASTLVFTNRNSHSQAFACHRITPGMVRTYGAEYPTIAPLLQDLLEGEIVLAYNSPFDMRLLAQTAMAHRLDCTWLEGVRWYDVQQLANAYYGKRIGLQKFMETYGIVGNGKHRAVEDCQDTLAVLKYIAEQRTSYEVNANE